MIVAMTAVADELERILETVGRPLLDLDDCATGAPTAPGKMVEKGNHRPSDLLRVWKSPGGDVDLQFLISNYVVHLRHHLDPMFELP
jgi:hypothetical protein